MRELTDFNLRSQTDILAWTPVAHLKSDMSVSAVVGTEIGSQTFQVNSRKNKEGIIVEDPRSSLLLFCG